MASPLRIKPSAWLVASIALLGACASGASPLHSKAPPASVEHTVRAGARVVVLQRPTPGLCRLSLFIDAGSRDASPPQAATVAAWLAAEHAGGMLEALVYPDVTELSRSCAPAELERCIGELARALSLRAIGEAAFARAQTKLEETRRRALAADPDRPVDELAVTALLGDAAGGFFPLGRAADDAQLTAAAVQRLYRDHYGPRRALLVAAGEVDPERVRELASRALSQLPAAAAASAQRVLEAEDEPVLQTAIDERTLVGFALAGTSESVLRAQVRALSERITSPDEMLVSGHVFGVRGGALGLVRIEGDPAATLARATRELVLLSREQPPANAPGASGDDLASISRELGLRFGTRADLTEDELGNDDTTASRASLRFGAGLLLAGAPGAGPRTREQLAKTDDVRRERAQAQFSRALATAEPRTSGVVGESGSAVVTDNGARIDVQFAHGSYVAIAVRIALGAEHDPPALLGRAALLASVTATACAGMGPERLRGELAQLGAALEPRTSAESYGLLLRAPRGNWRAALDFALRCARTPSRDPAHVAAAAVSLQRQLAASADPPLRARVAAQIAPRAPGMLAPWGDPSRIGSLTAREVADAFGAIELGARWSVAVVGPVPIGEVTSSIARRLADLPTGALPNAAQPGQLDPIPLTIPEGYESDAVTLLATWNARGDYGHALGATVFASALHAVLALAPGVEVQWQDADVYPAGAFAALRLRVSEELVPRMAAVLTETVARLEPALLEEALARGRAVALAARSGAEAEAAVRAELLARTRLGAKVGPPAIEEAEELLAALGQAGVRLSVTR